MLPKYETEDREREVVYYSKSEADSRRMRLSQGIYLDAEGKPADFKGIKLFVAEADGSLIAEYRVSNLTHHSSLAAGHPVAMAGWVKMREGRPQFISNGSGHYQPSLEQLLNLIQFWRQKSVSLHGLEVGFRVAITSSMADTFYYELSVSEFERLMKRKPENAQALLRLVIDSDFSIARRAKAIAHLYMVTGEISKEELEILREAVFRNDKEVMDGVFDLIPCDHFSKLLEAIEDIPNPILKKVREQFDELQHGAF